MARFADQRIVVTGAAGTIGGAIASAFRDEGARIVALDKMLPRTDDALCLAVDVADRAALTAVADTVLDGGAVDVLVNCHGVQVRSDAMGATDEAFQTIFEVNVAGAWRTAQLFGPSLRERHGAIVNVTSINGVVAARTGALYGASKAALNHLTKVLALELAPEVRVNAVAPTVVRSAMTEDVFARDGYEESKKAAIPLERIALPEDVAGPVLFLASADAGMITGHVLPIDGGLSLS